MQDRWFEDFQVGDVTTFGGYTVSETEILEFAERYDPQDFHADAALAEQSPFGGLIASGWHTAALMMRMMVDHYIPRQSSLGSPGVDELRWLKPVRPGDTLRVRLTVLAADRSRSKPDRGRIYQRCEVLNQQDDIVMTVKGMGLYRARAPIGS